MQRPLPFQYPNPTAPGSEHDETIVRMVGDERSWGDIESATESNAFDRYYSVLNPALKDSWTPERIDWLSKVVQSHVDKWAVKQPFPPRNDNNHKNDNNEKVLVLNVEDHIPWSDIALSFHESGSVCARIWTEFGSGRPSEQAKREMEAKEGEERVLKEKVQIERQEKSRQADERLKGEVAPIEALTPPKKALETTSSTIPPKIPLEPKNLSQDTPSTPRKSPSETTNDSQHTPFTIVPSQPADLPQEKPPATTSKSPSEQVEPTPWQPIKGSGQHASDSSAKNMRRTRLDSCYIKNIKLEAAQVLRMERVLQNVQRIKQAGVEKYQMAELRDQERVALLEKQDAVKKQFDSLRVDNDNVTSPWPTTRPIIPPRTLTTPFRPPLFPRYAVSATPKVLHRDIDTLTSEIHVASASGPREIYVQRFPGLSGVPLDTSNFDMTNASQSIPSTTSPNLSYPTVGKIFATIFRGEIGGSKSIAPPSNISENLSSSRMDQAISHVLPSNTGLSGLSTSSSEFRMLSITDLLAEHSNIVDRTLGDKRHWATTDENTIKKLKTESEALYF
ncbi:hypothetical protein MVEG_12124 [Podila verticillata NRRL 6337]|uniref:Uncharacterized protein n=1 Tax=Podila verticillata NRRL 6337 TaxID=1069443 RepID=A0A086TJ43_9FUNG|nr:hypothetical protein MVEG_12124 [Podila verticillata NRRL 6337]